MSGPRFASPVVMVSLAALCILAFATMLVLMAFGEDLKPRETAGPHAYSRSSTGFEGLRRLLDEAGVPVRVSRRLDGPPGEGGLRVLTPSPGNSVDFDALGGGAVLVVLPKWDFEPNPMRGAFERDTVLMREATVAWAFTSDREAEVARIRPLESLETPWGERTVSVDELLQLVRMQGLQPVILTPAGVLLGRLRGTEYFVLTDPDILSNHGITDPGNARLALEVIGTLRRGGVVEIDATLAGFGTGDNALRSLLVPPMLGVSLIGVASFMLLFWAALTVFGARRREAPALRLGKRALIDSTAGLFAMSGREGHMAPGYLELTRERLRRDLGLPRTISGEDFTALIDRMAKDRGLPVGLSHWEEVFAAPMQRASRLTREARALHNWTRILLS